jgi:predicted esterase
MSILLYLVCGFLTAAGVPILQSDDEFDGFPQVERKVGDNAKKTYYQIGPKEGVKEPEGGWKVMLILPGGAGSADFNPFCRRIHMNALPEDYIAVQLVAHAWSDAENRVVWPTKKLNPQKADFTTEEFIREAIADVKQHVNINDKYVFALGWSSGGPPLYVNSVTKDSPVTGTFVAMSVFHPDNLPDIKNAKDHPYYILHSPQDWINIDQHARVAEKELAKHGAKTTLQTYPGGHGWRSDPFGNIKRGTKWLEENIKQK